MKLRGWLWVPVLALVAAVGCGDDDDDGGGGGAGRTGSSGAAGKSGAGGGAGTTGGGGGGAGTTPTNACTNAQDAAATQAEYGGEAGAGGASGRTLSAIVAGCGIECLGKTDDDVKCTRDCVNAETESAVSANCLSCYLLSAVCVRDNCLTKCLADATSPGCLACRCNKPDSDNEGGVDCIKNFDTCSGFDTAEETCQ